MLCVKATPRLMGVEVAGDYLDFGQLSDALQNIIDLFDNNEDSKNSRYESDAIDQLRSLNYEIRSARHGDHQFQAVENGINEIRAAIANVIIHPDEEMNLLRAHHKSGNLYYKTNIPYVEAMGYLLVLNEIPNEVRRIEQARDGDPNLAAARRRGLAIIAFLAASLEEVLRDSLGEDFYSEKRSIKRKKVRLQRFDFRYIDLLNAFYMTSCVDLDNEGRRGMLRTLLLLLLRLPKAEVVRDVSCAGLLFDIPDYTGFARYMIRQAAISEDGEVYMDEIFGRIEWKQMAW